MQKLTAPLFLGKCLKCGVVLENAHKDNWLESNLNRNSKVWGLHESILAFVIKHFLRYQTYSLRKRNKSMTRFNLLQEIYFCSKWRPFFSLFPSFFLSLFSYIIIYIIQYVLIWAHTCHLMYMEVRRLLSGICPNSNMWVPEMSIYHFYLPVLRYLIGMKNFLIKHPWHLGPSWERCFFT